MGLIKRKRKKILLETLLILSLFLKSTVCQEDL